MTGCRIQYIAERGEERVIGNIHEVAAAVGMTEKHVCRAADNHWNTKAGWRIRRYCVEQWIYTATHPDEDDVVGTCEEVACLLGVSKQGVGRTVQSGTENRRGWTIKREKISIML